MNWQTNRVLLAVAVALALGLIPAQGARVFAEPPSGQPTTPKAATDTIVNALKGMSAADQKQSIEEAQKQLGLAAAAPNAILEQFRDTLSGYLANALQTDRKLDLIGLKKKAHEECTKLIQLKDQKAQLTAADEKFADDLAAATVLKESQSSPSPAPTAAGTTPSLVSTPAPNATLPPLTVPLILPGTVSDGLKNFLQDKEQLIIQAYQNNFNNRSPSPQELENFLGDAVKQRTVRPGDGTFLGEFNKLTRQKVTDFSQLAAPDQQAVQAMIKEVLGLPPPDKPPVDGRTDGQVQIPPSEGTQVLEDILDVAGESFIPGFSRFEPLVNELFVQDVVPLVERWRPFQRWRLGRRGVLLGGGYSPVQSSRTRYIIVDPP